MKNFLRIFIFLITINTYAQKETNFWYFGENGGLDFSSGSPVVLNDGKLNTIEGCSTISDKDGQLLFYSDGITVWNRNHEIMNYTGGTPGGNLLGNPSSTQSALVVPNPTDTNIYYLFTVDANGGFNGLNYYTIDVSRNGGLGEIIAGPVNLSDGKGGFWSEKVTAVKSSDCNTIWVLSAVNNQFYAYKITSTGVDQANPIISSTSYFLKDKRGYLKVSPDGKKIAMADYFSPIGFGSLNLYSFDDATGMVSSNYESLINPATDGDPYGIEFSQQSTKLYTSTNSITNNNNSVYQFDLTSADIASTKSLIHSQIGFRGALQLAVDGKIYATVSQSYATGTQFLDAIENPDADASDVVYTEDKIDLGGVNKVRQGLPPFIQSFFSPVKVVDSNSGENLTINVNQVCSNETLIAEPELVGLAGSTYKWTKEGDSSINVTTRKISIDKNNYGSGKYLLEMTIIDSCGETKIYNGAVEIEIISIPDVNAIPVYEQCDIDSNPIDGITEFNLQSKEAELTNNATNVTVDFFETSDTNFSSPITNKIGYRNTTSTNTNNHKLIVRVTNNDSGCENFGEIELKVNATTLAQYPDLYLSEIDLNANDANARNSNGSGNSYYNFDLKTTDIITNSSGAFSLTTHSFEYYRSANDAALQTNRIETPYEDDLFTNNSDVFVRISTTGSNACSGIGQFKIYVNPIPIPQGNINPTYLCVNNPVDNPQLITVDLNADTGTPTDTYQWFLNENLINGATGAIHKANAQGTYKVEAYRTYQNDITDSTDDTSTTGYNTFEVIESNKALIVSTELTDNVDNPNANILSIEVYGLGDYEFALNTTSISDFNKGDDNFKHTFNSVQPGLNTIHIRDINGCGTVSSQQLSVLFFQRHFTPNNDGILDTWKIVGINNNFYTAAKVQIFNRYGKLIALINNKNIGWDGTYNGEKLPSNDYWFNAVLEDINGNIRKETGHFSLIRK